MIPGVEHRGHGGHRWDERLLGERTLKNADGSGKVVDPPGGLEGSSDDYGRGDKVVGEGVVQVALSKGVSTSRATSGVTGRKDRKQRTWSSKTS